MDGRKVASLEILGIIPSLVNAPDDAIQSDLVGVFVELENRLAVKILIK